MAQAFVRGSVHFGMAVAGLTAYGVVGGLLGWMEPFWSGDYTGAFTLTIGIPLLFVETWLFLLLLQWKSSKPRDRQRTIAVAIAAFIGGAAFPSIVGAVMSVSRNSRGEVFEWFGLWTQLFGGVVAGAAITSILTWFIARVLKG